jgi:iron complex outermembrane recepter protein
MRNKFVSSVVSGVLMLPSLAYTNEMQAGQLEKAKSSNRLLEEVVVTAQKREENSQDVPVTISAFSGEKLEAFGIEDTSDLQKITPGLTFTQQYGYTLIYLRGVGSEGFLPNAEPSIATYIDYINIASAHAKQDGLGPVERVEILKGPQGTLYGRAATGGAFSIITKAVPTEGFTGYLSYAAGNYDNRATAAYFAGALTDSTGFSLSYYRDQHDHYGKRTINGVFQRDERETFSESYRLKFTQDIGDSISITGIAQKNDFQDAEGLRNEKIYSGGLTIGEPVGKVDRVAENDIQNYARTESSLHGLIVDWEAGPVDVKFIYSDQESSMFDGSQTDYDGTDELRTFFTSFDEPSYQTTYELQVSSNADTWGSDKLSWVAGLYHLEGGGGFDRIFFHISPEIATGLLTNNLPLGSILNTLVPTLSGTRVILESGGKITIESDSIFAQADYTLTDSLNLTFGLRYQEETRGLEGNYLELVNTLTGVPPRSYFDSDDHSRNVRIATFEVPDLSDESLAPRLALQWFASDDMQVYTSISRAFKSQTYNILNFFSAPDAVDKSTTTSVELGIKSDWLDGTLRLNGAIYKTVTEDPISSVVALQSGGVVSFFNAGKSEIEGVELDVLWQPMPQLNPGLAISGSASYIDATFTDFKEGRGYDENTGLFYGPDSLLGLPERDFTGNEIPRTPKFSSNLSVNQYFTIGKLGDLEFGVDYAFKDRFFLTASNTPRAEQDQYEMWSARASWIYEPLGITLTGFVNNLKDEKYFVQLVENDYGVNGNFGDPRLYGVKLKIEY